MSSVDLASAGISRELLWSLVSELKSLGLSFSPRAPLRILITRDLLDPGIPSLCASRATLLVEPGPDFWIAGPLIIPGDVSCLSCLHHWLRTTRTPEIEARSGDITGCQAGALRMAAALASQYVSGSASAYVTDALVSIDSSGKGVVHPVFPVRGCAECGGRHRPTPTEGLRVHCSPLTGIVQRMEIGAVTEGGLYHAAAKFFTPAPACGDRALLRRRNSYGRGLTAEEAETACLAEALERYSIIYRGDEPVVHAPISRLPSAISPDQILQFSARQFAGRDAWNLSHSEFQHIPEPFDRKMSIGWIEARRIDDGESVWLPAAHCFMWYPFQPGEPRIALADSNGCAVGRTFEDASLSALMELVERDAAAIWWYNRLRRPAVPAEDLEDESVQRVIAAFGAMGRSIVVIDITTDLGIPAVAAIAAQTDGTEPFFATSASLSRRAAAKKAVWEVCQIWHSVIRRKELSPELADWLLNATTDTQQWLIPDGISSAAREPSAPNAGSALSETIDRLKSAGLDPIILDLRRNDVILPAVRAVVPGLRHFWARFGPGRLYRTPVRMGWLTEATQEESLNPICCMI